MELVPIIYTALIIFAVLTVATILISYLLFKMRGNDQSEADEEKDTGTIMQPELINHVAEKSAKRVSVNQPTKKSAARKKEPARDVSKKKSQRQKSKRKPDPIKDNKRIKILNSITPDKDAKQKEDNIKETNLEAGSGKEYSDDDSEFFRLDTSGNNKKK